MKSPLQDIAPREEFTDICIDADGRWFTGNKPIVNTKVLDYFRKNLCKDEKGAFIWNEFGPFREKGYIKVLGPALSVIGIQENSFILNNGALVKNAQGLLVLFNEIPYLKVISIGVWASFPGRVANDFAKDLYERDGCFYFQSVKLELMDRIEWLISA